MELVRRTCVSCDAQTPRLSSDDVARLLPQLSGWKVNAEGNAPRSLEKQLEFRDFKTAMGFVNRLADLAESEGHHPDFTVRYGQVSLTLSTHATGGLSENDFILAAKIDRLQT